MGKGDESESSVNAGDTFSVKAIVSVLLVFFILRASVRGRIQIIREYTLVTLDQIKNRTAKIAVVGLGYVGLPLAAAFGRQVEVIGFDIHAGKVKELTDGFDATGELTRAELESTSIDYTTDPRRLNQADFIIVTVPTPIDANNNPDLSPVEKASAEIGKKSETRKHHCL